jgi:hypothetical protein
MRQIADGQMKFFKPIESWACEAEGHLMMEKGMAIPVDRKERAIYHIILADMHRLRGVMLNLEQADQTEAESHLREHFGRELSILLGKLAEWRQHRSSLYAEAEKDFRRQSGQAET